MRDKYLNTIGNLTLSGNNGKLGNKPFADKKTMNDEGGEQGYIYSRLWLNRDLQQYEEWGVAQVEERANRIAERFLKVWPAPAIEIMATTDSEEVNIFDADEPRHKRLDHAVFLGTRLQVTQVTRLYTEVFKQLIELQPEAFHETKLGERIQLSIDPNTLRQALQISDSYYIEGNIDSTLKFDRLKAALTDLGLEDDLLIKYA